MLNLRYFVFIVLLIELYVEAQILSFQVFHRKIDLSQQPRFENHSNVIRFLLEKKTWMRGNSYLGYYWTNIGIGTPPQVSSVIIDTGSSMTAIPCKGCSTCTHPQRHHLYDPDKSSTSHKVLCSSKECSRGHNCGNHNLCTYSKSFTEGSSFSGHFVSDTLWLGPTSDFVGIGGEIFQFGCHDVETNLFTTQIADGIMGFSGGFLRGKEENIVDILYKKGKISKKCFSLCLLHEGGVIGIGGVTSSLHKNSTKTVQYMPLSINGMGHYTVQLTSLTWISPGGDIKHFNSKRNDFFSGHRGVLIDSGTTFSYFPTSVYNEFYRLFDEFCTVIPACITSKTQVAPDEIRCFNLGQDPGAQFESFPTLSIEYSSNVVQKIIPSQYLFVVDEDNPQIYCIGIYDNYNDGSVIGANLMQNYNVIFDLDNNRIGFVSSNCILSESTLVNLPTKSPNYAGFLTSQTALSPILSEISKPIHRKEADLASKTKLPYTIGILSIIFFFFLLLLVGFIRHTKQINKIYRTIEPTRRMNHYEKKKKKWFTIQCDMKKVPSLVDNEMINIKRDRKLNEKKKSDEKIDDEQEHLLCLSP